MNEFMPGVDERLRQSRVRYRIQMRNRKGMQGREAMFVCQNFRVTVDERLFYVDGVGDFRIVILQPGDYFDVKVMAG